MYRIEWTKGALEELEKQGTFLSNRIIKKINELADKPFSKDIKKLKGVDAYRLRVGDYRIVFGIEKEAIVILKIGHRRNIYGR